MAWATWAVFLVTYVCLAFGHVPGLKLDRAGIAVVGATLMLVTGAVTFDDAARAIDFRTLALLFGIMIVVGSLRLSLFFEALAESALKRVRTPVALLAVSILLSGVLSAFLVNDIVCLALTPIVLHLARRLNLDPLPHLLGVATGANIGSVATITGNPQNMIVGSLSEISYLRFALRLAPLAIIGLALDFFLIRLIYDSRLVGRSSPPELTAPEHELRAERLLHQIESRGPHRRLRIKSLAVLAIAVALFFAGAPIYLVSLAAAAVILLGRVRPQKIYQQIDWPLLMLFAGLFVVVQAFDVNVVRHWRLDGWRALVDHPVSMLSVASAALSNLVSNVPAVLLFKPLIAVMPPAEQESAWLALAMSSTFAGNLTVLGSVANLIVLEIARREGVVVGFREYCRVGVPLTLLTLALGVGWLLCVPY